MTENNFGLIKKYRLVEIAFLIILITGLFLRFFHYFMGRSMWEDETHLALNVMKYGYKDLLKPLDYIQGAPILFLWIVKSFAKVFGYGELALRAFPLIASVLTLPLFFFLVQSLTKSKITALIGFLIYSLNLTLIYFSSEFKPYAVDVAVYVLMIFLFVTDNKFIVKHRTTLLILFGGASIMVSLSAFIVLFCIACNIALNWMENKNINRKELLMMFCWLVVFAFNYFLFIHNHPSTQQQSINYASAFCPTDIFSPEFKAFFEKTFSDLFIVILMISENYGFFYFLGFIFFVAVVKLIIQKQYQILLYTLVPIVLHLILSAFKIYPFVYRLVLYLAPALIILISYGTYSIIAFVSKKTHYALGVVIGLFCCYSFTIRSVQEFPHWHREIKPALDFVNDSLPAEHIYVADPIHPYMYYYDLGKVKNKIYRAMPWFIEPAEFYELVANERSNYILFYTVPSDVWGYGAVIEDLKKKNLIVKHFEQSGYGVSEVRTLNQDTSSSSKILDYTYFPENFVFGEDKIIAFWSGDMVATTPIALTKGNYVISVTSKGTPYAGVFPHHNLYVDDNKIGEFYNTAVYAKYDFNYEQKADGSITLKTNMDNDGFGNGEDRNSFILFIEIKKK